MDIDNKMEEGYKRIQDTLQLKPCFDNLNWICYCVRINTRKYLEFFFVFLSSILFLFHFTLTWCGAYSSQAPGSIPTQHLLGSWRKPLVVGAISLLIRGRHEKRLPCSCRVVLWSYKSDFESFKSLKFVVVCCDWWVIVELGEKGASLLNRTGTKPKSNFRALMRKNEITLKVLIHYSANYKRSAGGGPLFPHGALYVEKSSTQHLL